MRCARFWLSGAFLFLATCVWAMGNMPKAAFKDPLIGKPAPDVTLTKSDGTSSSVMSAREGKKGVLVFWATWCPHCREELTKINADLPAIGQKGIKIILMNLGETKEEVNTYLNYHQIKLVSFIDEENVLQEPYHLVGVPTLVFIDAQGIVRGVDHQFPFDYEGMFF